MGLFTKIWRNSGKLLERKNNSSNLAASGPVPLLCKCGQSNVMPNAIDFFDCCIGLLRPVENA